MYLDYLEYVIEVPSEGEFMLPVLWGQKVPEPGQKVRLKCVTRGSRRKRLKSARFVRVHTRTYCTCCGPETSWVFRKGA
jgi:hypothetical protein